MRGGKPAEASLNETVGVTSPRTATEVAGMTVVDVVGRRDEVADGHRPLAGRRQRGGNRSISENLGPD